MRAENENEKRVEVAVGANERYRSRARTVATMTAAAAAALSVGMVLAPTVSLSHSARVAGLFCVILLIVSTCIFVVASVTYPTKAKTEPDSFDVKRIIVWRLVLADTGGAGNGQSSKERVQQAKAVRDRISLTTDFGLATAGLAMVFLFVSLGIATFGSPDRVRVAVDADNLGIFSSCPKLPHNFTGQISSADLTGPSPFIPVEVDASVCGSESPVTLFLQRDEIKIAVDGKP